MKRYKIEIGVRIGQCDGRRIDPDFLDNTQILMTSTTIDLNSLGEVGEVLKKVEELKNGPLTKLSIDCVNTVDARCWNDTECRKSGCIKYNTDGTIILHDRSEG